MSNDQYDPFDLQGQATKKADQDRDQLFEQKVTTEDLKWIMSNKRGRRFIWRLLSTAGIYRTSFTGNSTTFFNEGMRNLGLMILQEIHEVCPDQYAEMVKETRDGKQSTKSNSSNDNDTRK